MSLSASSSKSNPPPSKNARKGFVSTLGFESKSPPTCQEKTCLASARVTILIHPPKFVPFVFFVAPNFWFERNFELPLPLPFLIALVVTLPFFDKYLVGHECCVPILHYLYRQGKFALPLRFWLQQNIQNFNL